MEKIEGGSVWMKSPQRCPVHGQMRMSRDVPASQVLWTCAGWDGEGCGYFVQADDVPWVHIGEAESIRFILD